MRSVIKLSVEPLEEGGGFGASLSRVERLPARECWSIWPQASQVGEVVLFPAPVKRGSTLEGWTRDWAERQAASVSAVTTALVHLTLTYSNESARVINYVGAIKKLGADAAAMCADGCGVFPAVHAVANARRVKIMDTLGEDASQIPQGTVLLNDIRGYEVLFTLGLQRLLNFPSEKRDHLIALLKTEKDQLTRELFPDLVRLAEDTNAENAPRPVALVALDALPSVMVPFFGVDRIALIMVPGQADASAGHLKNLLSAAEIPAIYGVSSSDRCIEALQWGAHAFISRGVGDGEVTLLVSQDAGLLNELQQQAIAEHVIALPPGPYLNRTDQEWRLSFEVDTFRGLSSVAPYHDIDIALVKLEFLLSEVAGKGKPMWELSQEKLVSIFTEFLKQSGPDRRVTFRLVDPIPETSTDKPSVPERYRMSFLKTQVRALAQTVIATGREVGLMIPNFQLEQEWNLIQGLIAKEFAGIETKGSVRCMPMIESKVGRKEVRELLKKTTLPAVALGLGDLLCNVMNMTDRDNPSIRYPAEAVAWELRKIKAMCDDHGVEIIPCGMLAGEPAVLMVLQALGINAAAFQQSNFAKCAGVISKLHPDACTEVVNGIMSGERIDDRLARYADGMRAQGIQPPVERGLR